MFRFASSVALRGGGGAAVPVYAAQAPGCSVWSRPCVACSSRFRVLHTSAETQLGLSFVPSPAWSSSGSQELDGSTLPGCGAPSPLLGPSLSFRAGSSRVHAAFVCSWELASSRGPAPQRMSTIQNLRKSLVRNWRPVCSVVGGAVSGAEFAPFPAPLPPASGGDGPVCLRLALLWNCSVPLFCE